MPDCAPQPSAPVTTAAQRGELEMRGYRVTQQAAGTFGWQLERDGQSQQEPLSNNEAGAWTLAWQHYRANLPGLPQVRQPVLSLAARFRGATDSQRAAMLGAIRGTDVAFRASTFQAETAAFDRAAKAAGLAPVWLTCVDVAGMRDLEPGAVDAAIAGKYRARRWPPEASPAHDDAGDKAGGAST